KTVDKASGMGIIMWFGLVAAPEQKASRRTDPALIQQAVGRPSRLGMRRPVKAPCFDVSPLVETKRSDS
ncbi:MAG: hypothetical protein KKE86_12780, partial [Planctomycetes bacterium]|nr:hypothetical protein [Planctomycetota bacterium]